MQHLNKNKARITYALCLVLTSAFIIFGSNGVALAQTTKTSGGGGTASGCNGKDCNEKPASSNTSSSLSDQPDASKCDGSNDNCCNGVKTSFNFGCKQGNGEIGHNPIFGLLLGFINFLAVGVGLAVVAGIIFAGYRFMTANGNSGQVEQAKTTIANAIIGLVLFAFMYASLNFIIPGGVFK